MKVLILGGDGYLGWPTAMDFASSGNDVYVVDNYTRRKCVEQTQSTALYDVLNLEDRCDIFFKRTGLKIKSFIRDLSDPAAMFEVFAEVKPDTIVHYAEQPSAPYSMKGFDEAKFTLDNNLGVTFNCLWALKDICPEAHLIKLGTMGEYGTPNIDIEEGWINIQHNGREDKFLYPRAAGSLYHTTKVLDTDLIWFYVRTYGLKVTDLMQGPVYGVHTEQTKLDQRLLPHFNYDDIFGTVVNRFVTQAVAGVPLTVFGKGGQTRGYLNILDTLQCVRLAADNPPNNEELRILNQFTETLSVMQIANLVQEAGRELDIKVEICPLENPRKEREEHYYNPAHSGLIELGLKPNFMTVEVLKNLINEVKKFEGNINKGIIMPRVAWSKK